MAKKLASLRILVPDGTTNYIQNPSVRFDVTGFTASSSTISRSLDYARFGIASLKVVTNGSALREGAYYRVNGLSGINDNITVSCYVRGAGKVRIRLNDNPGGSAWFSKSIFLKATRWSRIEVTGRCSGGNDIRLTVETDGISAQAVTFYMDGLQMERKPYSTSYCDGDIPGCRWNIIQSASNSSRDSNTRLGGKWITLSGDDRREEDLYMTVVGGLGMPPIINSTQSFATAPGGYFQSSKISSRVITMTFHARHNDLFNRESLALTALHRLRQFLIDLVKPDLTGGDQSFLLEYQDGDIPLYFQARYDGGLEGEWDIRNRWINSFPLRLLVMSPMIEEDNQELFDLDYQESFGVNQVVGRIDGVWNNMNYGLSGSVAVGVAGRKGEVFFGGSFIKANNNAAAIDPLIPVNFITYWDGTQFQKLSTGSNALIDAIAIAPNGNVYVGGTFTSIGGVSANYIAYWNGATWNALGTGMDSTVACIAIAPNGDIYAGGVFTTSGGVNTRRIAKWNGSVWKALGQYSGLANGTVNSMTISPDGTFLYIGGSFTDQFGFASNSLLRIAYYDVATDRFTQVGSGFNNTVYKILISPSGKVYACGLLTASGSTTCNYIAQLSGTVWLPMSSGMVGSQVTDMAITPEGNLVAVGVFESAGGNPCRSIALWNGGNWVNLDVGLYPIATPVSIGAIIISPSGDMFLGGGFNNSSISFFSGVSSISNTGSAEVSPFIYILGSGTLKYIENQTTKKKIYLNLMINAGEEIFIDFGKGTITSTVRGNLFSFILSGSDFNAFTLIPGINKICTFMTNDVGAVAKIGYIPTHWSMDNMLSKETV